LGARSRRSRPETPSLFPPEPFTSLVRVFFLTDCTRSVSFIGDAHGSSSVFAYAENTGPTPLILYTVYSPAEHNPSTVHKDKEEADKHEDDGTDEAPDWSQRSKAENAKLEEKK
jgi:hypothetical protein